MNSHTMLRKVRALKSFKTLQSLRQERGAIFVLTALLLPVLFGFLGIAYDVGNVYMHKARLQNVADAAALAGGRAYLDSQTEENPDVTDGIIDRGNKKLTADSTAAYPDGRDIPDVYNIGDSQKTKNRNYSNHKAADKAADAYIYHNIVNLGSEVKTDKWSHYAINSDNAEPNGEPKTFYRIGLWETVDLNFLPVFLGESRRHQIVRAGAIALVEPGKTTVIPGSGGGSTTITNASMFDNLFTFSDYFDPGLANANHQHNETFEGNMVFTFGNGSSEAAHYYDIEKITGGQTQSVDHLFKDSTAGLEDIINNTSTDENWKKVNDPIINTYFNTEAYMSAFLSKLDKPHYDVSNQNLTINGNITSNSTCRQKYTVSSGIGQGNYDKVDDDYYLLNAENKYTTFQSSGKTYTVCYHKFPNTNYLVRCGKTDGDNTYYMLTTDNRITNCYIKTVQPDPNNAYWFEERALIGNDTTRFYLNNGSFVDSNYQPMSDAQFSPAKPETPIDSNNFQLQSGSGGSVNTNVYHVSSKFYGDVPNLVLNAIGDMGGDPDEPIYVIVEANITHPQINIKNNTRPIIFIYLGTNNVLINNNGISRDDYAKLTIYAPYGTAGIDPDREQLNYDGIFYGNVIAKNIAIKASGGSGFTKWIQQNHLENTKYTDTDVAAVTRTIEETIKNATPLPENIKTEIMQRYANALTSYANLPSMDDPLFYSKLPYNAKQTLYATWKALRKEEKFAPYADSLWPWNEHFDVQAGEDQIVTTGEKLRLINYSTEYKEEPVVNPFRFLELDEERDAY